MMMTLVMMRRRCGPPLPLLMLQLLYVYGTLAYKYKYIVRRR